MATTYDSSTAAAMVADRGPLHAIVSKSPDDGQYEILFSATPEDAGLTYEDKFLDGMVDREWHEPIPADNPADCLTDAQLRLTQARMAEADAMLRAEAAAHQAREAGLSESEIARNLFVDRMTVRKWFGK